MHRNGCPIPMQFLESICIGFTSEDYLLPCLPAFDLTLPCMMLSETAFKYASYPSACFRTHSMAFSSRCMSNTLFNQRTSLALHPPQERMARNFSASSAYCRLDCHCTILPHRENVHTILSPTTKEKTLLDLMSKLCLWICSCGYSSCCSPCSSCNLLIASSCCKVWEEICA